MEIDTFEHRDIVNGFLETLDSLRPTSMTPEEAWHLFWQLNTRSMILVARENHMVIGTATLIIEQKFIHKGGKVGHIEDVAVHKNHQGKGIGQQLITHLVEYAKDKGCYKVILDCDQTLIPFYEKVGFREAAIQMRIDL